MMSLFSSFDLMIYRAPWVLLSLAPFFTRFYYFPSSASLEVRSWVISFLSSFFLSLKPMNLNKSTLYVFVPLFFLIFFMNFSSLFPFNPPLSSQASVVALLSFCLWLSFFSFSLIKNFSNLCSHMIPDGSPLGMSWFLFPIELISMLIRPITLMVRLVANILAGHLLMVLLCGMILSAYPSSPLLLGLSVVEFFVSLIQAYIFCTMVFLYFSEV